MPTAAGSEGGKWVLEIMRKLFPWEWIKKKQLEIIFGLRGDALEKESLRALKRNFRNNAIILLDVMSKRASDEFSKLILIAKLRKRMWEKTTLSVLRVQGCKGVLNKIIPVQQIARIKRAHVGFYNWNEHFSFADCLASYATETVMQYCHGRRKCSLTADQKTFGKPCLPESRMYLKVVYTCGKLSWILKQGIVSSVVATRDSFEDILQTYLIAHKSGENLNQIASRRGNMQSEGESLQRFSLLKAFRAELFPDWFMVSN